MFKNLVKRSTFKRFTISDTSPITLLLEGDEVYINLVPGSQLNMVQFSSNRERSLRAAVAETQDTVVLTAKPILQVNQTLCLNDVATQSGMTYNDYTSAQTRVMIGYSDNVTFEVIAGQTGTADVLVELVNYEPRH